MLTKEKEEKIIDTYINDMFKRKQQKEIQELKQEKQIQTAVLNRKIKQAQQKELKELKQEKEFYMKYLFKQQTIDEYVYKEI